MFLETARTVLLVVPIIFDDKTRQFIGFSVRSNRATMGLVKCKFYKFWQVNAGMPALLLLGIRGNVMSYGSQIKINKNSLRNFVIDKASQQVLQPVLIYLISF